MKNTYQDDKMSWIESDVEKIQMKTGMYISYVGEKGVLHLAKEVIQNAIDECANPKSPAKNIDVTLDLLTDKLTVEDDGRGIPETEVPIDILCTRLNSGSKFTREQGGASSGENGVGNTCVNALSTEFIWSSYRNGKVHRVEFNDGLKIKDETKKSKKEHGCILSFIANKKYLGKNAKLPRKGLEEWIDKISYFIPEKCKITLNICKGLEQVSSTKYKRRSLEDLLHRYVVGEQLTPYVTFANSIKIDEDFRGERKIKRDLSLEFVFTYTDAIEPWIDSYCNYVNTTSGGVHLDAVRDAIWRFFMKKTNESLTDREKDKYKILKVDVETGLNIVVNVFTDMQMQFVGQTKNEVSNDILFEPIKQMTQTKLEDYFNENKDRLTNIVKLIKTNCKARLDANKIRSATIKDTVDKFAKHKIRKFTPCNNNGKAYKELHICEGQSAAGSLVDGRDPDTQAFFELKGVTANGFKRDAVTILDNEEWRNYVTILGTNFGHKFDLNKCQYDKIIIETDSDIDGYGITSGVGAFHALYMPELVKAGKLYKAIAPLYHIDDKKHEFVRDKREYVELYQDKIIKAYEITLLDGSNKPLKTSEFREFIYDTEEYVDDLVRIAKHFGVNKFLIERVASYLIMNYDNIDIDKLFSDNKFVIKFMSMIQKKFPEIILKNGISLRGVIDGKFQSIKINNRFIKKIKDLSIIYNKYGYSLLAKEKKSDGKPTQMSICEFLDLVSKYKPRILTRYKGLGEANSDQLWNTTLNPDVRILIQLTMDDVEKDLVIFEKLHGQSKQNLDDRKKMMSEYKIKRDDLDN